MVWLARIFIIFVVVLTLAMGMQDADEHDEETTDGP